MGFLVILVSSLMCAASFVSAQELGQEALEGWVWGCYPPLLYTDILISGTTKTRVRKSRFQSLRPFGKALDCIRKWIQVDRDSGLVQPLLG